eukprot:190664_1
MGNSLKKANSNKTAVKHQNLSPKKVIMVGLDETGKTTILERISNDITMDEPVPGFTIETCKYKNLSINAWNIAANNDKIRSQWNALLHLVYQDTDGIIFVIDSCDRIRIDNSEGFFWDTVRRHFDMLLEQDYVKNATLLILANKEDKSDAMNINTISEKLELNTLRNRQWFITSCSAINENDYGVNKGFEWLLDTLNNNKYCICAVNGIRKSRRSSASPSWLYRYYVPNDKDKNKNWFRINYVKIIRSDVIRMICDNKTRNIISLHGNGMICIFNGLNLNKLYSFKVDGMFFMDITISPNLYGNYNNKYTEYLLISLMNSVLIKPISLKPCYSNKNGTNQSICDCNCSFKYIIYFMSIIVVIVAIFIGFIQTDTYQYT